MTVPEHSIQDGWLNARAQEIVRQRPGGPYPEYDREFCTRTMELVCRITGALTRGRSFAHFDADDVVQESNLRIVDRFTSFHGGMFRSWVWRIVATSFYDLLRSDRRKAATSLQELADKRHDGASPDDVAADIEVFVELDARRLIGDFLAWLRQRNPMYARMVELSLTGLTDQEIARTLGIADGTVRSALCRAPRDYRKFLARLSERRRLEHALKTH